MARLRPELMMVDGEKQPKPIVSPTRTKTPTAEELKAAQQASIKAAQELAMTPYAELSAEERAAMSPAEKTAYIKAAREEQANLAAEARAASDPMFDFNNRPEAQPADKDYIYYYAWVGGTNTGS